MTTERKGEKLPAPPSNWNNAHLSDEEVRERLRRNTGKSLPAWADERSKRIWRELGR